MHWSAAVRHTAASKALEDNFFPSRSAVESMPCARRSPLVGHHGGKDAWVASRSSSKFF